MADAGSGDTLFPAIVNASQRTVCLLPIELENHERHALHSEACEWPATNCYVDVWIELLHALGCDPLALLPCTLGLDYEGDQWTFFKPSLTDIQKLYGIDVQELTVWRPLLEHALTQISRGNSLIVEVDSWHLPDTAGTAYRTQHEKTSIALHSVDVVRRELRYFHNSSFYVLEGEDFDGIFQPAPTSAFALPPYVELVKLGRLVRRGTAEIAAVSLELAREHFALRPSTNPVTEFQLRLDADARWLADEGMQTFHTYAFATLRQLGAGFSMAASYLRWLGVNAFAAPSGDLVRAAEDFDAISSSAKAVQFALARAVTRRKPADFSVPLGEMENRWQSGMAHAGRGIGA